MTDATRCLRPGLALAALLLAAPAVRAQPAPAATRYWAYVANESSDIVSRIRFGPDGLVEEKQVPVGIMPADIDGPHGVAVSPDGAHWYVSLAHGTPFGRVWKFETGSDRFVDSVTAGLFPASMAVGPDGFQLFVVNFNLHGDHEPSSVSAIITPFMVEQERVITCTMPHGGRVTHDGEHHYSVCMMDDQLVELGTGSLEVERRMSLRPGHEGPVAGGHEGHAPAGEACKPTWVAVHPDDRRLYVPCNGHADVLEINRESLRVVRRFATGRAPYNAAVSPDGRLLVVTLKGAQAAAIFDLTTGAETRVPTTQPVTHGVIITPDSRYALVTNEAIGATPGTVDVLDLARRERVASLPLHFQPGGIALWKAE